VISHRIVHFGKEDQTLVVFDDFTSSPDDWIDDAAMLSYRRIGAHYPGVRAEVHPRMTARFLGDVMEVAEVVFGVAPKPALVESCYSIVTTQPADLTPMQRFPHFDSTDPNRLALLHYLSPGEQGGTAFYRHRATGFESVTQERLESYATTIDNEVKKYGLPNAAYIGGSTPQFDQISYAEARFNRAILYRGNTLHCADIPPSMALPADPVKGRLTVNSFFYCEDAA
jgi:Family of unknown function (DUF6445)